MAKRADYAYPELLAEAKKRCHHCACLVEGPNKRWDCGQAECDITGVHECGEFDTPEKGRIGEE